MPNHQAFKLVPCSQNGKFEEYHDTVRVPHDSQSERRGFAEKKSSENVHFARNSSAISKEIRYRMINDHRRKNPTQYESVKK